MPKRATKKPVPYPTPLPPGAPKRAGTKRSDFYGGADLPISSKIRSLEAQREGKREGMPDAWGSCDVLSPLERHELRCGLHDLQGAGDRNAPKLLTLLERAEDATEVLTQLSCIKADAVALRDEVESLTDLVCEAITFNPETIEELITDRGQRVVSQALKEELAKLVEKTIEGIRSDVQFQVSQVIATAQKHASRVEGIALRRGIVSHGH